MSKAKRLIASSKATLNDDDLGELTTSKSLAFAVSNLNDSQLGNLQEQPYQPRFDHLLQEFRSPVSW